MKLKSKVVVLTGGGKGLGRSIALGYALEGADLTIAGRDHASLSSVARAIEDLGRFALPVECDVTNENQVERMVQATVDRFGRIDVLVNNAGLLMQSSGVPREAWHVVNFPQSAWDLMMAVNLKGPFLCTKHVVPVMVSQKAGSLIHITSGLTAYPRQGFAPYIASKAGLEGFSRALAVELQDYGVRSNTLSPGGLTLSNAIRVDGLLKLPPELRHSQFVLRSEVIVPAAVYLASDASANATGKQIVALDWNLENGLGGQEEWAVTFD